jgi:hypothetical protein
VLVLADDDRVALLLRDGDRRDLGAEEAAFCAATALSWLASAMRSCASRSILKSVATFSAVSGMESTPYCSFISLLTKRQPMVVS